MCLNVNPSMPARNRKVEVRSKYKTHCVDAKQQHFNVPIARKVEAFVKKYPRCLFTALVLDSHGGLTSTHLRNIKQIVRTLAITRDREDYEHIPAEELGIEKVCCEARDVYVDPSYFTSHMIIIHDGHQTGKNTAQLVGEIFKHGVQVAGVCCNMVTRCGVLSHHGFSKILCNQAKDYNQHVPEKDVNLPKYSQIPGKTQTMQPTWFEFERKTLMIDLSQD